jgi:hypothetical protein
MTLTYLKADCVRTVVSEDGNTFGVVGEDSTGAELALVLNTAAAQELVIQLLRRIHEAGSAAPLSPRRNLGAPASVPCGRASLLDAPDGRGGLMFEIGRMRLGLEIAPPELKRLGAALAQLSLFVERLE